MKRLPQLDGVRGLAVALVILHHWTPWGFDLGLGNVGVQLFFVLSGFLITGILLNLRAAWEAGSMGIRQALVCFWQSRAARILPVFLVTLTAVFLSGNRFERQQDMGWHFAFASNLLFFRRGEFGSALAHFWTLAVEQQFYLLWPLVVLFLPKRLLEPALVLLIGLAPCIRLMLFGAGYTHFAQFNVLPFANLDSLGLGALIGLWGLRPGAPLQDRRRLLATMSVVAGTAVVANRLLGPLPANLEQSFFAIAFAWLILAVSANDVGPLQTLLGWRPLVALGVVSYAIYAYHVFAPRVVGAGLRALNAPRQLHDGVPLFILSAAVTVVAAYASWVVLERPINEARRRSQARAARPVRLTSVLRGAPPC